jgi:hypothetical protein
MRFNKMILTFAIFTYLVFFSINWAAASAFQWKSTDGGNDHWYEVVKVDSGISWTNAKAAAEGKGGHLATITSAEEQIFVFGLDGPDSWNGQKTWLGGYQTSNQGDTDENWVWVTGEDWVYTKWPGSQPDDKDGVEDGVEDYLQFRKNSAKGFWNDEANWEGNTNKRTYYYVVEYENGPPVPIPGAVWLLGSGLIGLVGIRRRFKKAE